MSNLSVPLSKSIIYSTVICILLITIDIYNLPSEIIQDLPTNLIHIIIIGIIIISMVLFRNFDIFEQLNCQVINIFDSFLINSIYLSVFWTVYSIYTNKITNYKSIIGIITIASTLVFIIVRNIALCKVFRNAPKKTNSIFDLNDIYENNFDVESGQPILISERDVNYDLLGRNMIVRQLYNYISSYHSDCAYTIALIGEWGSGKTTIINNVKEMLKNNKVICIDEIDPWLLGSKEALLISIYQKIINKTGIKFSPIKTRKIINTLNTVIAGYAEEKIGFSHLTELISSFSEDKYKELEKLELLISSFLLTYDKKVVVIVDNLERANAENIIFLFKLISTVFNIPNIIYVLTYDQERMDEILRNSAQINPKFIEKIVQQEIYIPVIDPNKSETLFSRCTNNIIKKYTKNEININYERYAPIVEHICKYTQNLRQYKRLINSAFSIAFCNGCYLDAASLLMLEIIHFKEPTLYRIIRDNRQYFISMDTIYDINLTSLYFKKESFNENGKKFFNDLFNRFPSFKALLENFFPLADRYNSGYNLISPNDNSISEKIKSDYPIYSTKYFDIYFSISNNDFSLNTNTMQNFIHNVSVSQNSIKPLVVSHLINVNPDCQKERLEFLYLHIDDLPISKIEELLWIIWENIMIIDDSHLFLILNAQQRALVIISKLLKKIKIGEARKFVDMIKYDYDKLIYINSLNYWIKSDKTQISDNLSSIFINLLSQMCNTVVRDKINLYEESKYRQHNILILIHEYKCNPNIVKKYISDIYNHNYVYRILTDLVTSSSGTRGYSYTINYNDLELLGITVDQISDSINKNPPKNESENILKEIFDKLVNNETDFYGQYGINSPTPIKFIV